jgi:hypothetical protein
LFYFLTAVLAELVGRKHAMYGKAANLLAVAFYLVVTLLFYYLFRPVDRKLSLLAAFLSFAGCAVTVLGVFHRASSYLNPLLLFGPYCLLIGYLIFRSTFLPRVLGVLMALAGLGWLLFLSPSIANHLSRYIEVLGVLAEGLVMLWLLVMGVNVPRWKKLSVQPEEL